MLRRLTVVSLGLALLLGTLGCSGGESYMPDGAKEEPAPETPPAASDKMVPPPPPALIS